MELFLLAGAALVAFGLVAAPIILWVSFRRTIQLRSALLDAAARIERLENALVAARDGQPVELPDAPFRPAIPPPRLEAEAPAAAPEFGAQEEARAPKRPIAETPFSGTPILAALAAGAAAIAAFVAANREQLSGAAAAAIAIIISAAAVALGEWLRRSRPAAPRAFICGLTIFGLAAAMLSVGYSTARFDTLAPATAFLLCACGALGAVLLSEIYGAPMLAFGLASALALPLTIGPGDGAVLRHLFIIAVTGMAIVLARRREAPIWAWIAGAGALVWGVVSVVEAQTPLQIGAASAGLALLAGLGLAYAWEHAASPLAVFGEPQAPPREPLIGGSVVSLACATLIAALIMKSGAAAVWAIPPLILLAAGAAVAAAFMEGLAGAALIIAAIAAGVLAVWPEPLNAAGVLVSTCALALAVIVAGWFMMTRGRMASPGALLAAIGPTAALVCAEARLLPLGGPELWTSAALLLMGLNLVLFARTARTPEQGAPFAAGALIAACAALGCLAPAPWRAPALALALPALAIMDRQRRQRSLRLAGGAIGALVLWRLGAPLLSGVQDVAAAAAPGVNALALGCAGAGLLFLVASYLFRGEGEHREPRATRTLFAAAALLLPLAAVLAARHVFNAGGFFVVMTNASEMGVDAVAGTLAAIALAWRFGPRPGVLLWLAQTLPFLAATLCVLFFGLFWLNPWWGYLPAAAPPPTLAIAYAAPALCFGLYAWLADAQDRPLRAHAAAAIAMCFFVAWATLEIRRLFHPADMARAPITPQEGWTLTLVWIAFAGGLAFAAETGGRKVLGVVARALAAAVLIKSALLDLGDLQGFARVAALGGISLACLAILLLRNRFWTPFLPAMPDPNLTPPR